MKSVLTMSIVIISIVIMSKATDYTVTHVGMLHGHAEEWTRNKREKDAKKHG